MRVCIYIYIYIYTCIYIFMMKVTMIIYSRAVKVEIVLDTGVCGKTLRRVRVQE